MKQPVLLVFIGGGIGSVARYLVGRLLPVDTFPTAILLVNLIASAILGWIVGLVLNQSVSNEVRLLVGVGFCGGLSTFSSFSYDTVALLQNGRLGLALTNIVLNVTLCITATALGLWLASR